MLADLCRPLIVERCTSRLESMPVKGESLVSNAMQLVEMPLAFFFQAYTLKHKCCGVLYFVVWIICQLCFERVDSNCDLIIVRWPHFLHPVSPPTLQLVSCSERGNSHSDWSFCRLRFKECILLCASTMGLLLPKAKKNNHSHGQMELFYFKANVWRGAHQIPQMSLGRLRRRHDGHN